MRALCGAIITAGALIGLGLTALAFGIRYEAAGVGPNAVNANTGQLYGAPTLTLLLVILVLALLVGLGTAFVGLAFHHERRYREHLGGAATHDQGPRMPA